MTTKVLFSITALLCALSLNAFAQDSDQNATGIPNAESADEKHDQIRSLRDALINALNEKDVDALVALVHKDVVLTTQDGDELVTIRKRAGVREYIERLLIGPDAPVKKMVVAPVVDELTILHGPDSGVAFGHSEDQYVLRDDTEFTLKTRWSATVVKDGDQWTLASLHVSSNLFENPVLEAFSKMIQFVGLLCGLVGLIVGFLLARFFRGTSILSDQ